MVPRLFDPEADNVEAQLSHLALIVTDLTASRAFYLSTLAPLNFTEADGEAARFVRLSNGASFVIVLAQVEDRFRSRNYHRKCVGLNHFAVSVGDRADVDVMARHLGQSDVPLLGSGVYDMAYRGGYYGLLFEDPVRIMIEIVHHRSTYFDR